MDSNFDDYEARDFCELRDRPVILPPTEKCVCLHGWELISCPGSAARSLKE